MQIKFQSQLLKQRKKHHLSQEQLAEQLQVTRQTISKWELGDSTPDLNRIESIADYFNIPIEVLLFGHVGRPENHLQIKSRIKQHIKEDGSDHDWHENHRWRKWQYQPITNGWEFLARYYWILFAFLGMIFWFSPQIIQALH